MGENVIICIPALLQATQLATMPSWKETFFFYKIELNVFQTATKSVTN